MTLQRQAVCMLQHDTGEIVKRFQINALRWVLRSPKTVYDPIRVLRALESHKPESDRGTEKRDLLVKNPDFWGS